MKCACDTEAGAPCAMHPFGPEPNDTPAYRGLTTAHGRKVAYFGVEWRGWDPPRPISRYEERRLASAVNAVRLFGRWCAPRVPCTCGLRSCALLHGEGRIR